MPYSKIFTDLPYKNTLFYGLVNKGLLKICQGFILAGVYIVQFFVQKTGHLCIFVGAKE
jgi:hypothetical protein